MDLGHPGPVLSLVLPGISADENLNLGGGYIPREAEGAEAQPGTGTLPACCAGRLCLSEAASEMNYAACVAGGRSAAVGAAVVAATVAPAPDPGHLLGPTPC